MHKAPYVFAISGSRKLDQLKGNIEASSLGLSQEDMTEVEEAAPFDLGFLLNWIGTKAEFNGLVDAKKIIDYVDELKPIQRCFREERSVRGTLFSLTMPPILVKKHLSSGNEEQVF